MNITIDIDQAEVKGWVRRAFGEQTPYATMKALNRTAVEVRDAIRAGIDERFDIEQPWVTRGVQIPIGGRATLENLGAEVELERRRGFLAKFEKGGRIVAEPGQPFPVKLKTPMPKKLYPKHLGLVARRAIAGGFTAPAVHTTRRGVVQFKGKHRTFMLDPVHHRGVQRKVILQRLSSEHGDFDWLWRLHDVIRVPPLLRFYSTAQATVDARFPEIFREEFLNAAASARLR